MPLKVAITTKDYHHPSQGSSEDEDSLEREARVRVVEGVKGERVMMKRVRMASARSDRSVKEVKVKVDKRDKTPQITKSKFPAD